jgi:hypothetical protein
MMVEKKKKTEKVKKLLLNNEGKKRDLETTKIHGTRFKQKFFLLGIGKSRIRWSVLPKQKSHISVSLRIKDS